MQLKLNIWFKKIEQRNNKLFNKKRVLLTNLHDLHSKVHLHVRFNDYISSCLYAV